MYIQKTIDEILADDVTDFSRYKLCYIDRISDTIHDYTPESKAYMERPEFDWSKEIERWGYNSPNLRMAEYPNPNYIEGEKDMYAYFTNISISSQWGDDWDDAPYEHNAGCPYDDVYNSNTKETTEHIILKVPFSTGVSNNYWVKFPDDYGCGNSYWSVEEINLGAVPWIFAMSHGKRPRGSVSVYSGINLLEFIYKISEIKNL